MAAKKSSSGKDGGFLSSLNPFGGGGGNDMTMWLVVGAGAIALYWYLNNYGPATATFAGGSITNAAGQTIGLSYWQTWFSTPTTVSTTAATTQVPVSTITAPGTGVTPPVQVPAQPVVSQPGATPPAQTQVPVNPIATTSAVDPATALITQSGGNPNAQFNVDQWNYFTYQLGWPVLTPTQSGNVANAAGGDNPMSVGQYLTAMQAAGLPIGPIMFTTSGGGTSQPGMQGIVPVAGTGMGGGMGMGMSFGGRGPKKDWRN